MSDEPDIDDPGGARGQPPAPTRPGLAPKAVPAMPRLPPPPAFVPPRSPGAAGSGTAVSKGVGGSTPGPVAPVARPMGTPKPPSLDALRRVATPAARPGPAPASVPEGLPPPPEFLPRASSAELPLERWNGGDLSEELSSMTLTGIPPLRLDEPSARDDDETPLDLADLEDDEPSRAAAEAEVEAAAEAEVEVEAEAEDVEIDVSGDTLPRMASALVLHEPYPSLPHAPSQVPTAPVPVVIAAVTSAAVVSAAVTSAAAPAMSASAATRGRTARALEPAPVAPRRPLGLWIGVGAAVGAVISIVAIVWASASSDPKKDAPPEANPPRPVTEVEAEVAPEPTPPPKTKAEVVAPAPIPAPKIDAAPEPTPPEPAEPEPAEPEPASEASVITVERDGSDYAAALAAFKATGSQKSLLDLTTAACALGDGPRARWAFRKLVGKTLRTKAIVACRSSRVDVSSTVEGYTGPELLAQARAALAAGDAKTALDKAHQSNKVERSSDAVLVKALAACKLGDGDQAQRLMPHMLIKMRPRLVEGCRLEGIELHE